MISPSTITCSTYLTISSAFLAIQSNGYPLMTKLITVYMFAIHAHVMQNHLSCISSTSTWTTTINKDTISFVVVWMFHRIAIKTCKTSNIVGGDTCSFTISISCFSSNNFRYKFSNSSSRSCMVALFWTRVVIDLTITTKNIFTYNF